MSTPSFPDRYEFSGTVLSGGQGDVYVCADKNLERNVAIKFLQDVDEMDRLLAEVSALQSLRSNHVVEIYDLISVSSEKEIGLVEEFIEGDDLFTTFCECDDPIDINTLLKTLYQISCGIRDIHSAGIIHRDIKLNNMKFDGEGLIKIFDFGLSKIVGPDSNTKGFKGTMYYAAPELYGHGEETIVIGIPVDIYAFGISAWLLATGELPIELGKIPPTATSQTLLSVRSDIPVEIAELIDRCVCLDPDDRPNIVEIANLLHARLTFGKHRGILTTPSKAYEISEAAKGIKIDLGGNGSAQIKYDGNRFDISPISGTIVVNNMLISGKTELPGASVIAFGDPAKPRSRQFLTFDVSHPEVVF